MDLSKLNYFFAAAEMENLTRAAEKCHIAQTSMSKYIASLEREVGVCLFERRRSRLFLNENGRRFYAEMKEIDQKYRNLCESLTGRNRKNPVIGVVTTDYSEFERIEAYEKSSGGRRFLFTFCQEDSALSELLEGRIDALIAPDVVPLVTNEDEFETVLLDPTPVSLFCSKNLFEQCESWADVIASSSLLTKTASQAYHDHCQKELLSIFGSRFGQVCVAASYPEQLLLLSLGRGFAILPQSSKGTGDLVCESLPKSLWETQKLIVPKTGRSPYLSDLIRFIHEKKC